MVPILIPGLLQTAEYARALFIAAGEDDERAEELVAAQMDRQAILDRSRPRMPSPCWMRRSCSGSLARQRSLAHSSATTTTAASSARS